MMFIYVIFLSIFSLIPLGDSFFTVFTRSEMTRWKERCGQSLLLNNNYWILQQTHRALEAIQNNALSLNTLPWPRLSQTIQQIYNACLIDEMQHIKERKHQQQMLVRTGVLLAEKAKDINQPSLIQISKD